MAQDLEQRIRATGRRLYELVADEKPSVFKKEFWTGKVLEWCLRNEAFKVEMFRFIDVFPSLSSPESVAGHLQEYFCRPGQDFPPVIQWGIKSLAPASFAARLVAKKIARNITAMAGQFIAGSTVAEALPRLSELRAQGIAFTADLLGEAVLSEDEAVGHCRRVIELCERLHQAAEFRAPLGGGAGALDWGHSPPVHVSIKPSTTYSQMNARAFDHSVAAAKERLRPVLRRAMELGAFFHLDMERTTLKNLTLALYRSLLEEGEFRDYPHTGLVLQGYLRECAQDLGELLQWARRRRVRCTIRLVKGAYWDAEVIQAHQNHWPVPVFTVKAETDANFERLARIILENHDQVRCACASHNIRSIAAVMETARELRVPEDRVEYQMLYGMAEPVRTALRKAGCPLRLYVPIGEMIPGMAYLVRRLLENTANESFLRQSFAQEVDRDELLRNPLELLAPEPRGQPAAARESRPSPAARGDAPPFHNEPPLNWTLRDNREGFARALADVRRQFPFEHPLVIGGQRVTSGREIPSSDPNQPDRLIGVVAAASAAEVEAAVAAARDAFPSWRATAPQIRASCLLRAAQAARRRRLELAALQVYEVGKNWSEADADVCEAIDFLEYYAREMLRLAEPRQLGPIPGEVSRLLYEPRGVAAVISPWNFPLAISAGMASAAIVTGNTVVYKPASASPVSGYALYQIFEEAGVPPGVVNFLPGSGAEVGDRLTGHPDVDLIAFTGSREVGLRILEIAHRVSPGMRNVRQVIAEMGGKNAIIVDADADLDEAVVHILQSAFGYQGQKCSACSRLIVLEAIYDRLVERLLAAARSIHLGPADDPRTLLGAVIDAAARDKVEYFAALGERDGTLLLERPLRGVPGHGTALRVYTDVDSQAAVAQEEIFGPLLVILRVRDFEEALAVANNTRYALTGALFSRSPGNVDKAGRALRVGNLYVNRGCTGAIVGRHPFGGFKLSGTGSKAGGPDYLQQFMVVRNVVENTVRRGFAPSMPAAPEGD